MGVLHHQSSNPLLAGVRAGGGNWEKIEHPKWAWTIISSRLWSPNQWWERLVPVIWVFSGECQSASEGITQAVRRQAHPRVNKQQVLAGIHSSEHSDGAGEGAGCQKVGHFGVHRVSSWWSSAYHSELRWALGWISLHSTSFFFPLLFWLRSGKHPLFMSFTSTFPLNPSEFPDLLAGAWGYIQVVLGQSTQEDGFELALGKAEKQISDYFLDLNSLLLARNPDWKREAARGWGITSFSGFLCFGDSSVSMKSGI